jgi:hypothetical protein
MRINSSGYVGIGTTSPGSPLSVLSSTATAQGIYRNTDVSIAGAAGVTLELGALVGTTPTPAAQIVTVLEDANAGNMRFGTRSSGTVTERMRIDSSGNVGINTTTPAAPLHVRTTANNWTSYFYNSSASGNMYGPLFGFTRTPNDTNSIFLYCEDNTNAKCAIYSNGTVTNRTGTYNSFSDIKLKQDITDASSQWNDIKALRIVKYRLKDEVAADPNYPAYIGVIAQEVEQVSPGLIDNCVDKDSGEVTKSVKSSIIYMKAVKALQEAMARIETLEAQNAAFEARLAALEAK